MNFARQSWSIAAKDLRSEFRTKESLNAAFAFAVVILIIASFAMGIDPEDVTRLSGGILWIDFTFAAALILNRSFARELPNDCLDALLSSPVSPAAIWFGKTFANFVFVSIIEALCYPIFGLLYGIHWAEQLPSLIFVTVLATWGICVVGTIFGSLTVNLQLRELMLPMLLYPALVPVLMASMELTTALISGEPISADNQIWIRVLAAFDIIFTALALALVDTILVG